MKNNSLFRQVSIFAVVFLSIFFMEGCASHQSSFAVIVDNIYSNAQSFAGFSPIVATVVFAFQIYCDFSVYSDIALGITRHFVKIEKDL